MKQNTSNSIFHAIAAWVKSALTLSKEEQANLKLHRDMWLGRRSPKLEKTVRHYSF
ncbi:hypothetical protein [Phaeovulum sp.]|uniref:hypothetical protein n=1 Tax=Phaeovulum sp. TaxID=2934796 RepID=UPI0039E39D7F